MSEKQTTKPKKVVYRNRHKSLGHLMEDDTKHSFEGRIRGSLQRQESEPVFFGVSDMTTPENSILDVFESVTQDNYQEAAKQRTTRIRSRLSSTTPKRPRQGTGTRSRSSRYTRQADCSPTPHLHEHPRAYYPPSGYSPVQASPEAIESEGLLDPHCVSFPSQLTSVPDANPGFHTFPTPRLAIPHTWQSFAFATDVPTFSPSTAFMKNNGGISGLAIDQSFVPASHPQQAPNDYQETCREGLVHQAHYIQAGPSTLPSYNFPAEAYNVVEFPFLNNNSFF